MSFKYLQRDLKVSSHTCTLSYTHLHSPTQLTHKLLLYCKRLSKYFHMQPLLGAHSQHPTQTHTHTHTHPKCETLWDALDTHPKKREREKKRNKKPKERDVETANKNVWNYFTASVCDMWKYYELGGYQEIMGRGNTITYRRGSRGRIFCLN